MAKTNHGQDLLRLRAGSRALRARVGETFTPSALRALRPMAEAADLEGEPLVRALERGASALEHLIEREDLRRPMPRLVRPSQAVDEHVGRALAAVEKGLKDPFGGTRDVGALGWMLVRPAARAALRALCALGPVLTPAQAKQALRALEEGPMRLSTAAWTVGGTPPEALEALRAISPHLSSSEAINCALELLRSPVYRGIERREDERYPATRDILAQLEKHAEREDKATVGFFQSRLERVNYPHLL